MQVLLIGPLPPPIGGDTRLFSFLASDLARTPGFEVRVLNSSRGTEPNNKLRNLAAVGRILLGLLGTAGSADVVSFHASDRGMVTFGPVLLALARLFRKRTIIRLFGGSFDGYYATQGRFARTVIRKTVLTSDVCLFQTKRLVEYFTPLAAGRVEWFSNYTRLATAAQNRSSEPGDFRCTRLVFLGHMWVTKGIDVILQSALQLPLGVTIDLFGPLDDYSSEQLTERGQGRVRYKGVLTNEQVLSELRNYHALVLPTFHEGEGYPGVLIEAFSHGLPVIVSRWMSIPEIVDETCGLLIAPKSVEEFVAAVRKMHDDVKLFQDLRRGALAKSHQFSDVFWTGRFAALCGN